MTSAEGTTITWGAMPDVDSYRVTTGDDSTNVLATAGAQAQVDAVLDDEAQFEGHAKRDLPTNVVTDTTVTNHTYGVDGR